MQWGSLFRQASRLAQEGYSRDEVREILRRAAELQAQAEKEQQERIRHDALRAGASAAGIRPEFLERALQEFKARRQPVERPKKPFQWNKMAKWMVLGILALPVLILVAGTLSFALSLVVTVLVAVGFALGIAGLVLLLLSPVAGIGLLIGLASFFGYFLGRGNPFRKGRSHRRGWKWDDDDDDDDDD